MQWRVRIYDRHLPFFPLLHPQLTLLDHLEPQNSSLRRFFMITSRVRGNKIPVVYGMDINPDDTLVSNPRLIQRHGAA